MAPAKKIILLGPPGSGKGTQAKRISEFCKIPHISTGEILRQTISQPTSIAKRIKAYMNKGELVPDEIIFSIIRKRLKKVDAKKGFVLDGFPRNIKQAKILDKMIGKGNNLKVFNLKVKNSTIIERLNKRRKNFFDQRDDDNPTTIKNRLKVYEKESKPLVEYYRKKGVLVSINGEGSEEKIFSTIKKYLK